jgi:hypothetical protein
MPNDRGGRRTKLAQPDNRALSGSPRSRTQHTALTSAADISRCAAEFSRI